MGGCSGDALAPLVDDMADDDAMMELRAPGGGARGGSEEDAVLNGLEDDKD